MDEGEGVYEPKFVFYYFSQQYSVLNASVILAPCFVKHSTNFVLVKADWCLRSSVRQAILNRIFMVCAKLRNSTRLLHERSLIMCQYTAC